MIKDKEHEYSMWIENTYKERTPKHVIVIDNYINIMIYHKINWFNRFMINWCFGWKVIPYKGDDNNDI